MSYVSAEKKIRDLASGDSTMQADFGNDPATFRWYDRQLLQNEIGKLLATGACARVRRISTIRENNQFGIGNLTWPRIQIDVLDRTAEQARVVANDVINFMTSVNLGGGPNSAVLLGQRADMIVGPQSPGGPVYVEQMDFRIANQETAN